MADGGDYFDWDDLENAEGQGGAEEAAASSSGQGSRSGASGGSRRGARGRRLGDLFRRVGAADERPRWRSGTVPRAPEFSGDGDPESFRKYERRVRIWLRLVSDDLPRPEQGLRLLEQLTGRAESFVQAIELDTFSEDDGVDKLLDLPLPKGVLPF